MVSAGALKWLRWKLKEWWPPGLLISAFVKREGYVSLPGLKHWCDTRRKNSTQKMGPSPREELQGTGPSALLFGQASSLHTWKMWQGQRESPVWTAPGFYDGNGPSGNIRGGQGGRETPQLCFMKDRVLSGAWESSPGPRSRAKTRALSGQGDGSLVHGIPRKSLVVGPTGSGSFKQLTPPGAFPGQGWWPGNVSSAG